MSAMTHEPITAAGGGVPPTNGHTGVAAGAAGDDEQGSLQDYYDTVLVGFDADGNIPFEETDGGIEFAIWNQWDLDEELYELATREEYAGISQHMEPVNAEPRSPLDIDPDFFDEEPMTDPDNEEGRDAIRQDAAAAVNETPEGATNMKIIADTADKFSSENLTWSQAQSIANTIGFLDRTVDPSMIADELYASRGMQAVDDLVAHLTTFMGRLDAEYQATANPDEEEQLRGEAA